MGDSRGIGPEVIARALSRRSVRNLADFLIIGDTACMEKAGLKKDAINIFSPKRNIPSGRAPLAYIDEAVALLKDGRASALVTAPVNKESIRRSGIDFVGHTEYLAGLTRTKRFAMMFTGGRLKVTTVTRHLPLEDVARSITKEKIRDAALLTFHFLKSAYKIRNPKLGVLALNPHAGEGGTLGREEKDTILPAVKALKQKIPGISGPIPADSAFNLLYNGKLDGLVAMYHDQAMIPVKMIGRSSCVNVTLGLPFIRTSPVHGTAYDIACKGIADPSGMIESIKLACRLAKKDPKA